MSEAGSADSAFSGWRDSESAAEAVRLFQAVQDWAKRSSLGDLSAHLTGDLEGGFATGSEECTLCPVCQLVGAVREHHPEVAEHLTDAVVSLAAAVRSALIGPEAATPPDGSSSVEHIDIG